jgi:hypothetical protein
VVERCEAESASVPPNLGLSRRSRAEKTGALPGAPGLVVIGSWKLIARVLPARVRYSLARREGVGIWEAGLYCLSYTEVLLMVSPLEFLPVREAVRVLPSLETTALEVTVTFPPFFQVFS